MDKIKIQLLRKEHAKKLFEVYQNTVNSDFKEWTRESKDKWFKDDYSIDFWSEILTKGKLPVFAAFDGNRMIGYAAIEVINFGVAYLGWIAVLKEYQKKGVGRKLIQTVENWCKKEGLHKIELETQIKDLVSYYEKLGYVSEGLRKNSWQHLDNYMFGKEL